MTAAWAVVLAGGRGARFWPLSRRATPKQCLALTGGRTLLQQTVDRLAALAPPERTLVVTASDMVAAVRAQLPGLPPDNVLVEPRGRNTAPSVGLAAVEVGRRGGEGALMAVLPADHAVERPDAFAAALRTACAAARDGALVTLGVPPTRPETGFGYLEKGAPIPGFDGQVLAVARFVEKPDAATAAAWLAGGAHLWNAGVFVGQVSAWRAAFRAHLPRSADALDALDADPGALGAVWDRLDATSVDYGVMERVGGVRVVPLDAGWSDVGTWPAAAAAWPSAPGGRALAGEVIAVNAADNAVHAPGKAVALVGVSGLVVVDTGDALLVMDAAAAQDLREVTALLEARGLGHLT